MKEVLSVNFIGHNNPFLFTVIYMLTHTSHSYIATITDICCLLQLKTVMMIKVYRNWLLNAIDSLVCFNIIIPAIFTLHSFTDKSLQTKAIDISL